MTSDREWMATIAELTEGLFDDGLSADARGTLNQILAQGPEQRGYYLAYANVLTALEQRCGSATSSVKLPFENLGVGQAPPAPITVEVSAVGVFGGGILGATSSFLQGWPLAYSIATGIFALALLIGSLMPVSRPQQIAGQSRSATSSRGSPESELQQVGRISAMVDCQWEKGSGFRVQGSGAENQESEIRNQKCRVALGDKFTLSSGLMEITYDTGAKVILQGPVTYEVESRDGGFLSVGKLTARVESTKSQVANLQISKSQISKFVVRTPTATITDLGTEFGVEVTRQGATTAHVFVGQVVAMASDRRAGPAQIIRLAAGQSVRVGNQAGSLARCEAQASQFVRSLPPPIDTLPVTQGLIEYLDAGRGMLLADADRHVWGWNNLVSGRGSDVRQYDRQWQPTLISGAVNKRPAIRFDGSKYMFGFDESAFTFRKGLTWFVVFCHNPAIQDPYGRNSVLGTLQSEEPWLGITVGLNNEAQPYALYRPTIVNQFVVPSDAASLPGGFHVAASRLDHHSGVAELHVDGRLATSDTIEQLQNGLPSGVLSVGRARAEGPKAAQEWFAGDLAEVLIYDRHLSDEEFQQVGAHLARKYDLPPAPPSKQAEQPKQASKR